jgi:hypothetical protein
MTVIEIKPHCNGWKVFEAPGVEPIFPQKDQAINYAQNRASVGEENRLRVKLPSTFDFGVIGGPASNHPTSAMERQWLSPRACSALSRFCSQSFLIACAPSRLFYIGCLALRSFPQ